MRQSNLLIKAKMSVALEVLSDIKQVLKEDAGLVWERIFHRATNAAGKSGRITGSSNRAG
jgi:hypothetical protein